MSLVVSLALTALMIAPVFMLAGWVRTPQTARIRHRFNGIGLNGRGARRH